MGKATEPTYRIVKNNGQRGLIGRAKRQGSRPGKVFMTWAHPSRNPVSGRTLQRARMVIGNEVTLWQLSRMASSRCQPHEPQGGILQEAKAPGKARGYADVETVTEKVKLRVANEATHG
jgi:hypothetical protein